MVKIPLPKDRRVHILVILAVVVSIVVALFPIPSLPYYSNKLIYMGLFFVILIAGLLIDAAITRIKKKVSGENRTAWAKAPNSVSEKWKAATSHQPAPKPVAPEEMKRRLKSLAASYDEVLAMLHETGVGAEPVEEQIVSGLIQKRANPEIMVKFENRNLDRLQIEAVRTGRMGINLGLHAHHLVFLDRELDGDEFETNLTWTKESPVLGETMGLKWNPENKLGLALSKDIGLSRLLLSEERALFRRQEENERGMYKRVFKGFRLYKRPQITIRLDEFERPNQDAQWVADIEVYWGDILDRQRKLVSQGLYSKELFEAIDKIAGHIRDLM